LFCQIYYYRWKRGQLGFGDNRQEEQVPLLTSEHQHADDVVPAGVIVVRYFCALAFVVGVGVAAWWITTDDKEKSDFIKPDQEKKWWLIQLLGWSSALLFVRVYRIPFRNHLISFPL